jgi:hypothetical protein
MAQLNWKRTKLSNPDWIEGKARCADGEYMIRGKLGSEYFVGYRRRGERRGNFVKIGAAANVPDAMRLAQEDNDARAATASNAAALGG